MVLSQFMGNKIGISCFTKKNLIFLTRSNVSYDIWKLIPNTTLDVFIIRLLVVLPAAKRNRASKEHEVLSRSHNRDGSGWRHEISTSQREKSLALPSCSPNYPRASRIGWTRARHCSFLKYKIVVELTLSRGITVEYLTRHLYFLVYTLA